MKAFLIIIIAVLSLSLGTAHAHQQKEAYITLLFNENSGNLEVSHRFVLHDAEHSINLILDKVGDLSTDTATQKRFSNYLQQHFALSNENDQPLSLASVGFEVDGKYFWVYQESKIPTASALKLKHTALHELWPSQTNHINIEKDGWVKSVRLQKQNSDRWHTIELKKP